MVNDVAMKPKEMLIGALLRVPSQAVHRRLIRELNRAGFAELALPHIAVFQFPGPDGVRPGTLAERAGISKQAMNRLLGSLEDSGYVARSNVPDQGRARVIRLTERGHAAYGKIVDVLGEIEHDWSVELGAKDFKRLKKILVRIWSSSLVR
jgi:DNA-binding MarR family transcriptional regulator